MKNAAIFVLTVALLAGGMVVTAQEKSTGKTKTAKAVSVAYACPMHPNVKSDKPGSCSTCNMRLEKMSTHSATAASKTGGKGCCREDCPRMKDAGGKKMECKADSAQAETMEK